MLNGIPWSLDAVRRSTAFDGAQDHLTDTQQATDTEHGEIRCLDFSRITYAKR